MTHPYTQQVAKVGLELSEDGGEDEEQCVCAGWVYKRGSWRNPAFQKRWMVLTLNGWLTYYKTSVVSAQGSSEV